MSSFTSSITRTTQHGSSSRWPRLCWPSSLGRASEGPGSPVMAGRCGSAACDRPSRARSTTLALSATIFSPPYHDGDSMHQIVLTVYTRCPTARKGRLSRALCIYAVSFVPDSARVLSCYVYEIVTRYSRSTLFFFESISVRLAFRPMYCSTSLVDVQLCSYS